MASAIIGGLISAGCARLRPRRGRARCACSARASPANSTLQAPGRGRAAAGACRQWWSGRSSRRLFKGRRAPVRPTSRKALHLSVAAGIRSEHRAASSAASASCAPCPTRRRWSARAWPACMPARAVGRRQGAVEQVLAPTGECCGCERESDLDAVTAVSGSGPAYVFYFLEAMTEAARQMGLSPEQGTSWRSAPSPARRSWRGARASRRRCCASASLPRAAPPMRPSPPWKPTGEGHLRAGDAGRAAAGRTGGVGRTAARVAGQRVNADRPAAASARSRPAGTHASRPANTVKPSQWFRRKALKQPSRERSRISVQCQRGLHRRRGES